MLVGCAVAASAQERRGEPFPIAVASVPDRSIDTGADLTFGAISAIAMLDDRVFSRVKVGPRLALPLGIAKAVFVDHPIAVFLLVLQHEAFGHGGRARELGSNATFRMGSPWTVNAIFEGGTRSGGGATFETVDSPQGQRIVYLGGTESNARSAMSPCISPSSIGSTTAKPASLRMARLHGAR